MRKEPKDWIFIDSMVLNLWSYKPINETQASVSGSGKVWNDKVRVGDGIIIKAKNGKRARLLVDEIKFTNETFDAVVTLNNFIN